MLAPFLVTDGFLEPEMAQAMRAAAEAHFGTPYAHRPETHMVWNYWFVPDMYTFLRAQPHQVLGEALVQRFHARLEAWSRETLGLSCATGAYLSLYVDGCGQGLHNDAANGRFGYVYSLTKDQRRSQGGETLVWRELDYLGAHARTMQASTSFYEKIPPAFNRLVVFDDRMPHAVERTEGVMDPLEGRLVLHGHLRDGGPIVDGPLPAEPLASVVQHIAAALTAQLGDAAALFDGLLVFRFTARADGTIAGIGVLLDRLRRLTGPGPAKGAVLSAITTFLGALRFPSQPADSRVTLPIAVGVGL